MKVGERVELHPGTDEWMSGDRYGEIVELGGTGKVHVKLDKSGRIRRYRPDRLEVVR